MSNPTQTTHPTGTRTAILFRMVMPEHTCPYGLKAKDLLERRGFTVEDHRLTTRAETDRFKDEQGVKTHAADLHRRPAGRRVRRPAAAFRTDRPRPGRDHATRRSWRCSR